MPMRIVIAPQAFKGSLAAPRVAEAIALGVARIFPTALVDLIPLADGGEGTLEALVAATGGEIRQATVTGPLGTKVVAQWGMLGDHETGVVEMAAASGLPLVPAEKRNPLVTTSYGTGELIAAALDAGCRKLIVGLGGSATNDGGAGMAQALGARLLTAAGEEIGWGGLALSGLERISLDTLDPRLKDLEVIGATDVDNPLCGLRGASAIYGPQKGATPDMVTSLDRALDRYSAIIRRDLGVDVKDLPGAGAAGGLGAGLVAFLGAKLRSGAEIVLEATGLRRRLAGADLAISGEGRLDGQTVFGKTVFRVAKAADEAGVPLIAVVGGLGEGYEAVFEQGVQGIAIAVPGPVTLEVAMANAFEYVADAAERSMRLLKLGAGRGNRSPDMP